MIVASIVSVLAVVAFGVYALNAQRDALNKVVRLAAEQSRVDANERHVLVDRIQHPSIVRPHREPMVTPPTKPAAPAGGEMAGRIMPNLTAEQFAAEFVTFGGEKDA